MAIKPLSAIAGKRIEKWQLYYHRPVGKSQWQHHVLKTSLPAIVDGISRLFMSMEGQSCRHYYGGGWHHACAAGAVLGSLPSGVVIDTISVCI